MEQQTRQIAVGCIAVLFILAADLVSWSEFDPAARPDDFESAALEYKIPVDYLRAVSVVENTTQNPFAVSRSGAIGMMQIMPVTGKWACGLSRKELFDRRKNIHCGALYLSYLNSRIRNKYGPRPDLVLAAYNSGPGNVDKYRGVPPFPETRAYIKKVHLALKEIHHGTDAQPGN